MSFFHPEAWCWAGLAVLIALLYLWNFAASRHEVATFWLWQRALAEYEAPPLDPAIREALQDYVARRREQIGDGEP